MLEIQKDLRERLAQAFPDIKVSLKVPETRPCPLIILSREGGRNKNKLLDRPGVGIYCWHESESKAEKLAIQISKFMNTLAFEQGYEVVIQEIMMSASDPDTNVPRWYLSYTITTHNPKG